MSTPSSSRKMRRSRENAAPSNDEPLSGFHLYEIRGDAAAALNVFSCPSPREVDAASSSAPPTFANKYNCALLSHVIRKQQASPPSSSSSSPSSPSDLSDAFSKDLDALEAEFKTLQQDQVLSARKRKRNDFILAYNRALVLHASGDNVECAIICADKLGDVVSTKQKTPEELSFVASRMAFLFLESMLTLSVARHSGLSYGDNTLGIPTADSIVEWLEHFDAEKDPQLKFLLTLYKSRLGLAALDSSGKHVDSKIRSARKELKQAMDIYQHKLRPSFGCGETSSVVSSANSEENMSTSTTQHETQQQQQPPSSVILQKYNQSALNLKANLEQFKGNTKKSLILCSEALAVAAEDPSYDAVHSNNLAVVYETNNKRHLALHALSKALRSDKDPSIFHKDGTARADYTIMVLYNASTCALQTRNFLSAYECMATCVVRSVVFANRPRSWLRMAEACMGLFTYIKSQYKSNKFSAIEVNGEPKGIVVDNRLCSDTPEAVNEELVSNLASPEDLEQVKRNPLLRARASLEHALQDEFELGQDATMSARLTLAYVYLAFREHRRALEMANHVLEAPESSVDEDEVTVRVRKRRVATARMYAAEASCALGETVDAMKFLVGDGQDDAFDRLASDLGGVTIETAATNGKGKRRLARAQAMVRSSASAATAALGNITAAKQLAMSAQAMEDAYASNRERSSARRALIYCLLRGKQNGPALNLLRSLR